MTFLEICHCSNSKQTSLWRSCANKMELFITFFFGSLKLKRGMFNQFLNGLVFGNSFRVIQVWMSTGCRDNELLLNLFSPDSVTSFSQGWCGTVGFSIFYTPSHPKQRKEILVKGDPVSILNRFMVPYNLPMRSDCFELLSVSFRLDGFTLWTNVGVSPG